MDHLDDYEIIKYKLLTTPLEIELAKRIEQLLDVKIGHVRELNLLAERVIQFSEEDDDGYCAIYEELTDIIRGY